jgi:hypothetical protein
MSGEMSATEMVDLICAICRNRLDQPPNGQLFSCDVPMAAQLAPPARSRCRPDCLACSRIELWTVADAVRLPCGLEKIKET